ncbi:MAG: exo-alpha-sialidase [Verrucomicrobia bacterium]|nr:exo-alpha-sialidase [Verrucomicrobiota bacterium]
MNPLDRRSFVRSLAAGSALAALPRLAAQNPASLPNTAPSTGNGPNRADGLERRLLRPLSPLNPKNTEGSGVVLKDGSVLLLWTEFMDVDLMPAKDRPPPSPLRRSPWSDDGYARISGIVSQDGGRTWGAPRVYADDADARVNTMSPALARLPDGRLMLAYSWRSGGNHKDNYGPCARRVRFSRDEGATWSDAVRITPDDGTYHTGCHDRAWALPSGRLLVQCHTNTPRFKGEGDQYYHKNVYIAYSDDGGATWKHSNRLTENVAVGLNESCVARRADGSLYMVLRSWRGQAFASGSTDHGATWSEPRPSGVIAPDAPTYLTRIPRTDDLLMIWNCNFNLPKHTLRVPAVDGRAAVDVPLGGHATSRCPLLCAVSKDGGRHWGLPKVLENDINYEWAYPGVVFHGDHALVHYFRSPVVTRGRELMLTRVPIKWLYADIV